MKYLKKIILENFQSHKYTELEFTEGLNIILGPSDTGKTAIIRALKWALYNEPAGDFFIRKGETDCTVTLEFSDNTKVKRIRTKSKNIYLLINSKGDESHFEGFGTSVPEEIISEIAIKKSLLDDSESSAINMGEQLDGPFLLSERTSVRASAIGRIVGVNIIDDALKETLRDLRNYSLNRKDLVERCEQLEEELNNYKYLDTELSKLDKLKVIQESLINNIKYKESLIKLSSLYKQIINDKRLVENDLANLSKTDDLEKIYMGLQLMINRQKLLFKIHKNIEKNTEEIYEGKKLLLNLKNLNRIQGNYEQINEKSSFLDKLFSYKEVYDETIKDINKIENILKQLVDIKEYETIISRISIFNDKIISLNKNFDKLSKLKIRIKTGHIYLEELKNIDKYDSLLEKLEGRLLKIKKLNQLYLELKKVINNINKENQNYNKYLDQLEININKYQKLLSENLICPYCFSEIDDEKIKSISKNL